MVVVVRHLDEAAAGRRRHALPARLPDQEGAQEAAPDHAPRELEGQAGEDPPRPGTGASGQGNIPAAAMFCFPSV